MMDIIKNGFDVLIGVIVFPCMALAASNLILLCHPIWITITFLGHPDPIFHGMAVGSIVMHIIGIVGWLTDL